VNLPRRIGRYEIAGILAQGDQPTSSTIFIARMEDATPIVVKRVASLLTTDKPAVQAYLDAAHTAAEKLRHGNVVEIREVGEDGNDVFVATSYVMGEAALRFIRHLARNDEALDSRVAAYTIAEAAAGLAAGHAAGLVHGHVTPSDILLGYDGSVKVLDLGVAAARATTIDRSSGGRAQVRELAYASPERCRAGQAVEPASDVWSLGVILTELLTGASPFSRDGEAATIQAVCEEPMTALSSLLRGRIPDELFEITIRTLDRDPSRRGGALELRERLLRWVKPDPLGGAAPRDDLGRRLTDAFAQRVADKREMLGRLAGRLTLTGLEGLDIAEDSLSDRPTTPPISAPIGAAPPVSRNLGHEEQVVALRPPSDPSLRTSHVLPSMMRSTTSSQAPLPVVSASPVTPPEDSVIVDPAVLPSKPPHVPFFDEDEVARRRRLEPTKIIDRPKSRGTPFVPPSSEMLDGVPGVEPPPSSKLGVVGFVVVVLALVGGAIGLVLLMQTPVPGGGSIPSTPLASPASIPTAPAALSAPIPPSPESPSVAPAASGSLATAPPSASSAVTSSSSPATEEAVLTIDTVPTRATILIGGAKKGVSPIELKVPKSNDPMVLEIRHPGYVALRERVVPNVNQRLKLTMMAAGRAPTTPSAAATYHKFE
jgi:serine/threonine protein kinase